MAVLTVINNPFEPHKKDVSLIKCKPIWECLPNIDEFDYAVSLNGFYTEEYDYILKSGDSLTIVPIPQGGGGGGGKNILATVAMVALVVAAPMVGTAALNAVGATTALSATAAYGIMYGVQAAVMIGGGMLISSLTPTPQPSVGTASNSSLDKVSPTYSFNGGTNAKEAGAALPIMLGEGRITPPIIGDYLSLKDDKQHLNMLMVVNDGEVDEISDIEINDQPITNFKDIEYSISKGTNIQDAIGNFKNSESTIALGRNLNEKDSETTYTTAGNVVDGLEVVVAFPRGLYYITSGGSYTNHSASFEISYKLDTDTEWTTTAKSVSGTYRSAKRFAYEFKDLTPGKYDVKVKRTSTHKNDSRTLEDLQLDYVNEIVTDNFTYPNTAVLSINALATDQLNGGYPKVTCRGKNILTRDAAKPKDNPAWACYDLLKREGILDEDIDLVLFQEWADYCELKNYRVGLCIDTQQELQAALNMVSLLGRATVVQFGSVFTPIIDKAVDLPTQGFLFTNANMIEGSFQLDYIPYNERANVIEVTYYDETDGYKAKTLQLQSHDFDANSIEIKSSITLYGCTNRQQAADYAQYLLNKNRYLSEMVVFTAGVDSIACTVGDVIEVGVQHMTGTILDGRLAAVNGNDITLDAEVTLEVNEQYELAIRLEDDTLTSFVYTNGDSEVTLNTLTFVDVPTIENPKNVVYAFGKLSTKATNYYRVLNITRASDLKRKIVALEYNAEVYNDSATINVEEIDSLVDIQNLAAVESLVRNKDGSVDEILTISWSGSTMFKNIIVDGTNFGAATGNSFEIKNTLIPGRTYEIQVGDKTISHAFVGASKQPEPVTGLNASWVNGDMVLKWDRNTEIDFKHYEINLNGQTHTPTVNSIAFNNLDKGSYQVEACCIDTSKNRSHPTSYTLDVNKPCLIYLMRDSALIEKAFLDGAMTIYTSFNAPSNPNQYDIWKVTVDNIPIGEFTYGDEILKDVSWNTGSNGELYKYYRDGEWIFCTNEQIAAIRRMLGQLTQAGIDDNEVKVFNVEPYTPYEVNDLWVKGLDIYKCTTTRATGNYNENDWTLDTKDKVTIATKIENTKGAA